MNIRLADHKDKTAWDDFVLSHAGASPYHCFAWREAVEEAYGHQGYYLMAEDEGRIVGVLPLVLMRCPLLYSKVVSLPFCDVGGMLAAQEDVVQRLYDEAFVIVKRVRASSLEIRCRDKRVDTPRPGMQSIFRTDKVSMILNLPGSSVALWDGFKSKLRSQVRKAEKNNLTFSWGEKKDIGDFYTVFSRNMRELGSPVHSRAWIEAVLDGFGSRARMGLVYRETKPVGAGIILCNGSSVSIPWASTLRECNHLSPNMLLYWNFLKFAADSSFTQFDFGRSTYGEGTFKFKAQWGAEPHALFWQTHHFASGPTGPQVKSHEPSSRKIEIVTALWSRLPLWLVNLLGPRVRRHISL